MSFYGARSVGFSAVAGLKLHNGKSARPNCRIFLPESVQLSRQVNELSLDLGASMRIARGALAARQHWEARCFRSGAGAGPAPNFIPSGPSFAPSKPKIAGNLTFRLVS